MQSSFENLNFMPRRSSNKLRNSSLTNVARFNRTTSIMMRRRSTLSSSLPTLLSLLLILSSTSGYVNHKPCPKYGCPLAPPIHEPFVPAPPGYTPKCVQPGLTFCESLDRYPQQLIKFLIEKRAVDFENFLRDESTENFDAFRQTPNYEDVNEDDEEGYGYPKPQMPPPELYPPQSPPPRPPLHFNVPLNATSNRYLPVTNAHGNNPFLSHSSVSVTAHQSYSYQLPSTQLHLPQYQNSALFKQQGPWPRNSRGAGGYSLYRNPLLEFASRRPRTRAKRQADSNTVSICPTRSQYVSPRAALNNQGNWMYVVNLEEQQKYSQLVKSEVCMSETCDGLCSLPLGYKSKCQQQYVQKRLIALEGSGDRLYTDVFWFPHGCMCQVALDY